MMEEIIEVFVDQQTGKKGFIKRREDDSISFKEDEIIVPCKYDDVQGCFSEDFPFAAVLKNGNWGFVNKVGVEVVPCIFSDNQIRKIGESILEKSPDRISICGAIANLLLLRENKMNNKNLMNDVTALQFAANVLANESMEKKHINIRNPKKYKLSDDLYYLVDRFDSCIFVDGKGKKFFPFAFSQKDTYKIIKEMYGNRNTLEKSDTVIVSDAFVAFSKKKEQDRLSIVFGDPSSDYSRQF